MSQQTEARAEAAESGQRHHFNPGFDRFSGLYLLALFIIVFGIWVPDKFLTTATLHSIASEQAIVAMLGLAVLIPLSAGVFDLSIGAMINMSAIVVSLLQVNHDWPMVPSIIAAIIVTTFIGFVNGFLVVKLQISAFIATLGSATIIGAFQVIITNQSQPLPPTSTAWNNLTQQKIFGFQIVFLYLIVLALIAWWVMDHTPPGRYIYATGGNPEAARLSGVKVGMWVWLSFVASGFVCGIAGVLYASQNGPSLTFGASLLLPAYAAAFLGSTQLKPGRFNVWGTIIAVYVLAIGVKGLSLVTSVQWLNAMFNGVALLAAVAFAGWEQRRSAARRRAGEHARPEAPPAESPPPLEGQPPLESPSPA